MKYAEITYEDRDGDEATLLLRFEDALERMEVHYDFETFYIACGLPHEWRDITWSEARRRYDLRRFDIPWYLEDVTVGDRHAGPMATRLIYGIRESAVYEARRRCAILMREKHLTELQAEAAMASAVPTFDDLVGALA